MKQKVKISLSDKVIYGYKRILEKTRITLIFFFLIHFVGAQTNNGIIVDDNLKSKILNEEREIQIYLPPNYNSETTKYPVLYLLDGQRFFNYGISLHQTFSQFQLTPDFIIVGIKNSYPHRFINFSSGTENFSSFINDELIPFIDLNYRTTNERLFFGWEYAGSFSLKLMITSPHLYKGIILASPYPLDERITDIQRQISANIKFNNFLFFSVSNNEGDVNEGVDNLNDFLINNKIDNLSTHFLKLEDEEHRSTPYSTLYHGLRRYFSHYPELQIDKLEDFIKAGELEYAYKYNTVRAAKYGFSPDLTSWTKFTIIRSAMSVSNYERFDFYVSKLGTYDFFKNLKVNRAYSIAAFYEENNRYNQALSIYRILNDKNPNSKEILSHIARVLEVLGDKEEAKKFYKKAERISNKSNN